MDNNDIVICVSGGNVNGVFTSNPSAKVYLVDYDNLEIDPRDDCSQSFPTEEIDKFKSFILKEGRSFPGLAKLAERFHK